MKDDIKWKHETFLYPVVRVFSSSAAGSGTIIYSEPDPKNEGEYLTFVLTNHHVIESLIKYKKEWDSLLKKDIDKEFKDKAKVEHFQYVRTSTVDSSNRFDADIIAYDKNQDLAILKIDSPRKFETIAKLIPKDKIKDLRLFMEVVVSGCSLAHEPFCNFGQLTYLKEIIDQRKYVMVNCSSIFGNSGGALFLGDTGELIGVPSRITGIQVGFGVDIITWMGFSAHPERLYEFMEDQELKFLYDSEDNYYKAMDRRKNKKKEALLAMKAEVVKQEASSIISDD
uniref:Putative trypsin-like peptidase domain containing protein n=2 Tax=viral metagenome TaxID=1070528 RepID=A0A6H1Z9A9_9ZZZZ